MTDNKIKWNLRKTSPMQTFQLGDYPELIHIIKTGFENRYYVVYEDAYEMCNGMQVESYTKEQIESNFGIKLDYWPP